MSVKLRLFALFFLLSVTTKVEAFPDLIRHHYVNCTTCHVSPTGGGLMTSYGRAMSRELLSASGGEREAEFLHGLLPESSLNEWLNIGGDVRVLQLHTESPERKSGRTIPMQAGLEIGITHGPLTGVAFIGQPVRATRDVRPVAPRYYLLWNARDELAFRYGRFLPAFGIHVPYHTLPTRQGLGLGAGQERETLEGVWSGETWNFAASAGQSPQTVERLRRETLLTAQLHRTFNDSHRIGVSLLRGTTPTGDRNALGVHGVFGISEEWAYLSEFDWQWTSPRPSGGVTSLFHFSQLIWEFRKGWNLYLMEDYTADLSDPTTLVDSRGAGLRYFPRPHIELDLAWFKKRTATVADRYDDFAWLLLHYYF